MDTPEEDSFAHLMSFSDADQRAYAARIYGLTDRMDARSSSLWGGGGDNVAINNAVVRTSGSRRPSPAKKD